MGRKQRRQESGCSRHRERGKSRKLAFYDLPVHSPVVTNKRHNEEYEEDEFDGVIQRFLDGRTSASGIAT